MIEYLLSNESTLLEVTRALSPRGDILAVGAGGDVALSLLEFGDVCIVDENPDQLFVIEKRYEALQRGDFDTFTSFNTFGRPSSALFDEEVLKARRSYFFERFSTLKGQARFVRGNVFAQEGVWDTLYLSNALTYEGNCSLRDVQKLLRLGGRAYFAAPKGTSFPAVHDCLVLDCQNTFIASLSPSKLWDYYVYFRFAELVKEA